MGIDLGTSAVKAVVIDAGGSVIDHAFAPLLVSRPNPTWSEQDPESWWAAAGAAVGAIDPAVRRNIAGIGLTGQMHGATLLGADHQPLRPAILWNDGRSFAECDALESTVPSLRKITGNQAMPGFTAPKLLWVSRHEPEVFNKIRTVLLPKDYLRLKMTGVAVSDMSDSAGTLWLDVAGRRWNEAMLSACGLEIGHMPALLEGNEVSGKLRREIAMLWGMDEVPVVAGGGDNAAGAVGVGVVRDGDALLSLGTSGVIFVATAAFRPNPGQGVHAFCHCLPGMWHQMAVHLNAASCIDWAARLTGAAAASALVARAEATGPFAGEEIFLPYLSGERTPHNDPRLCGAFGALNHDTDAGRLAEAVLEGVAFALADGLAALRDAGTRIDQLVVIGGGAQSTYWGRLIASALETTLIYVGDGEVGPALGAARLASLALDGGSPSERCVAPSISHIIEPDATISDHLAGKLARFRAAGRHMISQRIMT